ncbi:hypothetical protein ABTD85_21425, partial [Acinetobacter baumannii]
MPDVRVINGSFGPILAPGTTIWETGDQESRWQVVRSILAAGKVLVMSNGNEALRLPVLAANPTGIVLFPYIKPAHAGTGVYD